MAKQTRFIFAKAVRSAIKQERRDKKKQRKRCRQIATLERNIHGLTANEAVELLINEFNFGKATIQFSSGKEMTIEQVGDSCGYEIDADFVSPILFWGGPPNNSARQFQGTLKTLVMDRILYTHAIKGGYADLIYDHHKISSCNY